MARGSRAACVARAARIVTALAAVWIVGATDVALTLQNSLHPEFLELNPVARAVLVASPEFLALYKFGLLGCGSIILFALRAHWQSELGAWILAGSHLALAFWWTLYLHVQSGTLVF